MILVTSVAPNSENSLSAIKSWHKYGKVYSLNSVKEIAQIKGYTGVTFIPTHRTMEWNNRPLVTINALIDLAIEKDEDLLIINSDIIIANLPEFKSTGITIFSRFDFTNIYEDANVYEHGRDAFYIPKEYLRTFPPSVYCLGNTWVDYAITYRAMTNGIPVYWADGRFIYHKMHPFVWDFNEWEFMGRLFQWEFKFDKHLPIETIAGNMLQLIKTNAIKVT